MGTGAITQYVDLAQLILYVFWAFFFGLIYYLTLESKREGFPLEYDQAGKIRRNPGLIGMPPPKVFKTQFHGDVAWSAELGSIALVIALSLLGLGLVAYLAYLAAQTTVYTLTNQRVVMRVGIVLTVSFNLPFKRIVRADIHEFADGTGNIPLQLAASDKIAYFHLWPHARPWYFAHPEPMLRSIPNVTVVAQQLTSAWQTVHTNQAMSNVSTGNAFAELAVEEQVA